jgi:hypothetical protein
VDDIKTLLTGWRDAANDKSKAHERAARRLQRQHKMLGIPAVVINAIVATAVFISLTTIVEPWVKALVGAITVTAAILSALLTWLNPAKLGELHKRAAASFSSYAREIEMLFLFPPNGATAEDRLKELNAKLEAMFEEAPQLGTLDWQSLQSAPSAARQSAVQRRTIENTTLPTRSEALSGSTIEKAGSRHGSSSESISVAPMGSNPAPPRSPASSAPVLADLGSAGISNGSGVTSDSGENRGGH